MKQAERREDWKLNVQDIFVCEKKRRYFILFVSRQIWTISGRDLATLTHLRTAQKPKVVQILKMLIWARSYSRPGQDMAHM